MDNSSSFKNYTLKEVCRHLNISQKFIIEYIPNSNQSEIIMKYIGQILRALLDDNDEYEKKADEELQLKHQELIDSIFNEDNYSMIRKELQDILNVREQVSYLGTEYGKLLLDLYAKELLNTKKEQVGGGISLCGPGGEAR